jgi:uncharacterized protein YeaC (DUF1315 family)
MNTTTEPKTEKGKEEYDPAYIEIKGIGADDHAANIERVKDCYKDYARPPVEETEPAQDQDPGPAQVGRYKHKHIDVNSYPDGTPITIKQEAACLKALDMIFDAHDNKELMPYNVGIMDLTQILMIVPKTEIGRRILSRFYDADRTPPKMPVIEYPVGPSLFDIDLYGKINNVIKSTDKTISIISGADRPIIIQGEHFLFYLAPRVEG